MNDTAPLAAPAPVFPAPVAVEFDETSTDLILSESPSQATAFQAWPTRQHRITRTEKNGKITESAKPHGWLLRVDASLPAVLLGGDEEQDFRQRHNSATCMVSASALLTLNTADGHSRDFIHQRGLDRAASTWPDLMAQAEWNLERPFYCVNLATRHVHPIMLGTAKTWTDDKRPEPDFATIHDLVTLMEQNLPPEYTNSPYGFSLGKPLFAQQEIDKDMEPVTMTVTDGDKIHARRFSAVTDFDDRHHLLRLFQAYRLDLTASAEDVFLISSFFEKSPNACFPFPRPMDKAYRL